MNKYTKGPWVVEETEDTDHILSGEDSDIIAYVDKAFGNANAHLIAASPDLLFALTELVSQIYQGGIIEYMNEASTFSKEFNKAVAGAEKALKKARGES